MLTRSQDKALSFIRHFIKNNNYSPTVAEIAEGIGIKSRGVAHRYLKALARLGCIELTPNRHRNIRLLDRDHRNKKLPLIGYIAAGQPIEAIPQQETIDLAGVFLGEQRYALRVKGDSMIDEGIFDGDVVICEQADQARNGQIVVALIDDSEATLKQIFYQKDGTVKLVPANVSMQPVIYPATKIRIQGIYIGLLRINK